MPPFRLELPDRRKRERTQQRLYVAKGSYSSNVRMPDWDGAASSLPIDDDPLDPEHINHFVSHYRSFGIEPDDNWVTTTHAMLEQVNTKDDIRQQEPQKCMVNFFTFKETNPCQIHTKGCSHHCTDYRTTMQSSYKTPYPYSIKRLAMPSVSFMEYRKMKGEGTLCEEKFFDDGFAARTKAMTMAKQGKHASYNPCTDLMSDGTPVKDRKQACFFLEF